MVKSLSSNQKSASNLLANITNIVTNIVRTRMIMNKSSYPGILITFEGGEGGGKTTQTVRIKNRLLETDHPVLTLREPGGTNIAEQIREVVLSPDNKEIAFTTEVLLFQSARAQIYHEKVIPALKKGKVVLMDRSRDSSVVYQGIVRGFGKDLIQQLNNISTNNVYPDLTLLLDIDVKTGLKRREITGEINRLDLENKQFHQQVRQAYLDLAKECSQREDRQRWVVIDASQKIDAVEAEIWQHIQQKLSEKSSK